MKTKVLTSIILVAMILITILSGCGATDTNKETATADQTVTATEETKAPTEAETESPTEEDTEAPTEKESEADKDNEDDKEDKNKEETSNKSKNNSSTNTSSNSNSSSGNSSASTTNKKPSSSSNSSSSSSSNSNLGSSSSSNSKPSSNSNSNSSSSSSSNSSSKPATVVTDDTDIPHSQLCTDANMQKVTSAVNDYFINLGMIYNPSLNANNCGWFLVQTNLTTSYECSVNYFKSNTIYAFESDANAFLSMSNATYSDLTFYCYAEYQGNGEYNIYFCHE